jgi:peptidoglycan/xylan/chitin deacetylase (PgdA/CDA1 family)
MSRFIKHIQWLRTNNYYFIKFSDWINSRTQPVSLPARSCILTFDGPHANWFRLLVPYLVRENIPAAFFVVVQWLEEEHPYSESRGQCSWEGILGLRYYVNDQGAPLFEIGSHSFEHSVLEIQSQETEAVFSQRLRREIVESARVIQERIGEPVQLFALPKGKGQSQEIIELAEEAGYRVIRRASLPGRPNAQDADLYTVEIQYCDHRDFSQNDFQWAMTSPFASPFRRQAKVIEHKVRLAGRRAKSLGNAFLGRKC